VAAVGKLVTGVPPGVPEIADMASAAAQAARKGIGDRRTGERYDWLLRHDEAIVRAFAGGLHEVSRKGRPVVLLLDTCELLGNCLDRLFDAIRLAGAHVVWVLGVRLEPEDEAGRDSLTTLVFRGTHHSRMTSQRLIRFDDQTIQEYLKGKLGDAYPDDLDIEAVAEITRGIPLAVSLLSRIMGREGFSVLQLRDVSRFSPASKVIRELAEYYLKHTEHNSELRGDLPLLYGLALLSADDDRYSSSEPDWYRLLSPGRLPLPAFWPSSPRDGSSDLDVELLAALWAVPPDRVEEELRGLARRHDFVLSGKLRMHEEVRAAIRGALLLDPFKRSQVVDANQRAVEHLRDRLEASPAATIDGTLDDQEWRRDLSALLWHTYWTSPDGARGTALLADLYPRIALLAPDHVGALLRIAEFFAPTCPSRHQALISSLASVTPRVSWWSPDSSRGPLRHDRMVRDALDRLAAIDLSGVEPVLPSTVPSSVFLDLLRLPYGQHEALPIKVDQLEQIRSYVPPGSGAMAPLVAEVASELLDEFQQQRGTTPEDADAAIRVAQLLVDFQADKGTVLNRVGLLFYDLGRYERAGEMFERAVALDPGYAVAHSNRGAALAELGRHAEALAAYDRAVELDPGRAYAHNGRGNALSQLGRHAEALAAYDRAVELDPGYAYAHNGRGNALSQLGRHAEALAAYDRAVELDPGYAYAHNGRGNALYSLARYAEALAAFERAVELKPRYVTAHNNRGTALAALERYSEAVAAARRAVEVDPENAVSYNNLGWSLLHEGDIEGGIAALDRAVELDSQSAGALFNRARGRLLGGDPSSAQRDLEVAVGQAHAGAMCLLAGLLRSTEPVRASDLMAAIPDSVAATTRSATAVSAFRGHELTALSLACAGQAGQAEEQLRAAIELWNGVDLFDRVLYGQLCHPPIAGLERLMAVWRELVAAHPLAAPWGGPDQVLPCDTVS